MDTRASSRIEWAIEQAKQIMPSHDDEDVMTAHLRAARTILHAMRAHEKPSSSTPRGEVKPYTPAPRDRCGASTFSWTV
jgi:hypothetical protein